MDKDYNIHTCEIFKEAYKGRTWEAYRDIVARCIMLGEPGLWLDLGAGCGFSVECADRFGINCIGIEGSQYAVSKANNRYPKIVCATFSWRPVTIRKQQYLHNTV